MSKKVYYLCENEYGNDPCEWAIEGRKISEDEVSGSMGEDAPSCPGLTRSGRECSHKLVVVTKPSPNISMIIGILLGLAVVSASSWFSLQFFFAGEPQIDVQPETVFFSKSKNGKSSASVQINNLGDAGLDIEKIVIAPSEFSVAERTMEIEKKSKYTLLINFEPYSDKMVQGTMEIYSNTKQSPVRIRLVANQDPWWVLEKLENSSKILSKED